MTPRAPRDDPPDRPELASLADESLAPEERARLEAELADSPDLAEALEEQERGMNLVRSAAAGVEAPMSLREGLEAQRTRAARPRLRSRWAVAAAVGGGAAAIAVGLALVLPGASDDPTVTATADLATRPVAAAAPAASSPTLLAAEVDGVPFPNWSEEFALDAEGSRVDALDGRQATTVFYDGEGSEVAYSIVSGDALPVPEDATRRVVNGVETFGFTDDGREVVTWERAGHTCVLSSADLDGEALADLAVWMGAGTVPF